MLSDTTLNNVLLLFASISQSSFSQEANAALEQWTRSGKKLSTRNENSKNCLHGAICICGLLDAFCYCTYPSSCYFPRDLTHLIFLRDTHCRNAFSLQSCHLHYNEQNVQERDVTNMSLRATWVRLLLWSPRSCSTI